MVGIAQAYYLEKYGKLPWKAKTKYAPHRQWPLLDELLTYNYLSYFDYALAERLLRENPQAGEEVAATLCHLSLCSRKGHLCISVKANVLHPTVQETWGENREAIFKKSSNDPVWQQLSDMVVTGMHHLPDQWVSTISENNDYLSCLTPLCRFKNHLYLQRNWFYESLFLHHFKRIYCSQPDKVLDASCIQQRLEELKNILLPEQSDAILGACQQSFFLISGGPGTGKTFTAGQLINTIWEGMLPEDKQFFQFALAAPTGKAAANLEKSIVAATRDLKDFPLIKGMTLHHLLGINSGYSKGRQSQIPADLILIDESSMIDLKMMSSLFSAVKNGARLILLGDRHQLPPIESGNVFADLITEQAQYTKGKKSVGLLKKCLRSELQPILDLAKAVNEGNSQEAFDLLSKSTVESEIYRLTCPGNVHNIAEIQTFIADQAVFAMPSISLNEQPVKVLECFNQFRLLSPLVKGPFGTQEMNSMILQKILQLHSSSSRCFLPIMIAKNDHQLELFNGEVGVLVKQLARNKRDGTKSILQLQEGDYALFFQYQRSSLLNGSPFREIPALMLPAFELAFCLSVHKSQGSEFDHVLLMLPEGSEGFGKEILYTGMTRAKRQLGIWSSDETLKAAIEKRSQRLSGLPLRLGI